MENEYLKKLNTLVKKKCQAKEHEKVIIVDELKHKYSLKSLLKVAKLARSVFYYLNKLNQKDKYKEIKEEIYSIFHKHKGRYGYRRITLELRAN